MASEPQKADGNGTGDAKKEPGTGQPSPVPAKVHSQVEPAVPTNPATGANQHANTQDNREGPSRGEFIDWQARSHRVEIIQAGVNIGLLALALVGAYFAYGQLVIMDRQNSIMEVQNKIMVAQMRPSISLTASSARPIPFTPAPFIPDTFIPEPLQIRFDFTNDGQSVVELIEILFDVIYFSPNAKVAGVGVLNNIDPFNPDKPKRDEENLRYTPLRDLPEWHGYILTLEKDYVDNFRGKASVVPLENTALPTSETLGTTASKGRPFVGEGDIREGLAIPVVMFWFSVKRSRRWPELAG